MDWMMVVLLVGGFVALMIGAEILVRGASRLAAAVGISPLVIGLTVVAFGTSAPELAINLQAAFSGEESIALGNVVGSNIMNVLVILGISAFILPLMVNQQLIRQDVPIMIGVTLLFWWMASDGFLSRLDGAILFGGLVIYVVFNIVQSRKENNAKVLQEYEQEYAAREKPIARDMLLYVFQIVFGLVLLTFGSDWLVEGAVQMAYFFGVSELVVGLTIVAVGTSLPELATSIVAALRNERDIAVGNVVGSNIFNLMSVLGVTSLIAPNGIPIPEAALGFDILVMVAVAVITFPIFFTGGFTIERWEGATFLASYLLYLGVMLSDAINGTNYQQGAPGVILLLVVLIFGISFVYQSIHKRKNGNRT